MKITVDRKLLVLVSAGLVVFAVSGALMGRVVALEGTYGYLKLFNEALYLIVNNYVQPVQIDGLMEGAYRGMLESLDPANEYLPARIYEKAARGETAGPAEVGAILSKRRSYISVVSALPGSPAAEAGLKGGDLIITIAGKSTRLMGLWEAGQALRGRVGSKVELTVATADAPRRRPLSLVRRILAAPGPVAQFEAPDTGVVRIGGLREGDARRVDQAIASLKRRGVTRLLLDLRGCSSDALAEAIGVVSLFMRQGPVVSVTDRYDGDKVFRADGRRIAWERLPVVALVDEGTSEACEVMTAALRDGLGFPVVGERTWGHGVVRRLLPLQHGDGVILATGRFESPAGKEWNGKGLEPDLTIEGDPSGAGDPQRRQAVDYLRGVTVPPPARAA
ncbi:MAG: S41 family peptidase [Candidatus Polarisedimenticolia bacterium]